MPPSNNKIQISKLDAATRQLETAIRLWFYSGDPVSIHSLSAAAHTVLHDVAKHQGKTSILKDMSFFRPEKHKEIRDIFNKPQNFFKHADEDPDELLEFNPQVTEIFMLDALLTYEGLTGHLVALFGTFKSWMLLHHPELIEQKLASTLPPTFQSLRAQIVTLPKVQFLQTWLPVMLQHGAN
jgi:hypothetical protein